MTRASFAAALVGLAFAAGRTLAAAGLAVIEAVVVALPVLIVAAVVADVLGREQDTRRACRRRITDLGGKL